MSLFSVVADADCFCFFLYGRPANWGRDWKGSFCLLAIVHGDHAVFYAALAVGSWQSPLLTVGTWIAGIGYLLTALVLAVVAWTDLRRVHRDWLHCLGISVFIGSSLIWLSSEIVQWLTR